MRIDLSCPVELRECALPTEEYKVCDMTLFNLSEKAVKSVQACFICYDEQGEEMARSVERVLTDDAQPRSSFTMSTVVEEAVEAAGLEVIFEKVFYEDGTVWRRTPGEAAEFQPTPMLSGNRLEMIRQMAGEDAITYPSDQGAVWVCVCGRPNAAGEDTCRRCGRDKHDVFIQYNEAAVEKNIFEMESRLEEEQRLERERVREEQRRKEEALRKRRRRRNRVIGLSSTAVVVGVLGFGVYFHAIPYYRYSSAMRKMENRSYEDAKKIFAELDEQCKWFLQDKDFRGQILECDYRAAKALYNDGNASFASLEAAWKAFDQLSDIRTYYPETEDPGSYGENGGYKDSALLSKKARYAYAEKLLQQGNWNEAIAAYDNVPGYSDGEAKKTYARYQIAKETMQSGDYEKAYKLFTGSELKGYEDCDQLATECRYLQAQNCMIAGDYLKAVELYTALGNYKESSLNLQKAYYAQGDKLFNEADYNGAAEYFLKVSNYSDAYRRATQCLYEPALKLMEEGRYQEAADSFSKIINYNDSHEKMQECYYLMAKACADKEDWDGAVAYLDKIPEYEEGIELRKECIYVPAMKALEEGREDDALEMFILIGDYKDAKEYASHLLYARGIGYMNEKNWEAAAEVFARLGDYRESEAELKSARYGIALNRIDSGDYDEAIEILTELGNYEKAQDYIHLAEYRKAEKLLENKEYVPAAEAFEQLGDYKDSHERYSECIYRRAMELSGENDLEGAVLMLKMIPGYSDADKLLKRYGYDAAKAMEEAGELSAAARMYDELGDYSDAGKRAGACRDQYYATAYTNALDAYTAGDYATVIELLEPLDMSAVGSQYADLKEMYQQSCYVLANRLYENGDVYGAYAYYKRIPNFKDVAEKKLNRTCYRMLGTWESAKGQILIFREDGTCTIEGRDYYFNVPSQYSLYTGDRAESLKLTYEIVDSRNNDMTLKNKSTGSYYRLTRVTEESAE